MFELKLKKLTVVFDFSFFATVSLLILLSSNYAVWGVIACLWHELGHLIFMRVKSVPIKKMVFYGAGIKIIPDKCVDFTSFGLQLGILAAGSTFNFIAAVLCSLGNNMELHLFAVINAVIGVFNLLPLQHLDGGKLITLILYQICSFQQACLMERYLKWLNVILIVIVLTAFSVAGRGNITLYITLCYWLFSAVSY